MMLRYALSASKEKGMKKVLVGCYKDNIAFAATIRKNGGVLVIENENYTEGRTIQILFNNSVNSVLYAKKGRLNT